MTRQINPERREVEEGTCREIEEEAGEEMSEVVLRQTARVSAMGEKKEEEEEMEQDRKVVLQVGMDAVGVEEAVQMEVKPGQELVLHLVQTVGEVV